MDIDPKMLPLFKLSLILSFLILLNRRRIRLFSPGSGKFGEFRLRGRENSQRIAKPNSFVLLLGESLFAHKRGDTCLRNGYKTFQKIWVYGYC